jgi:hypothetical protein
MITCPTQCSVQILRGLAVDDELASTGQGEISKEEEKPSSSLCVQQRTSISSDILYRCLRQDWRKSIFLYPAPWVIYSIPTESTSVYAQPASNALSLFGNCAEQKRQK